MAMAIAAFLAGCAGSVYAHYARFISPDSFGLNETFMILSMLVFGGMGTSAGPILGAFTLIGIQESYPGFARHLPHAHLWHRAGAGCALPAARHPG